MRSELRKNLLSRSRRPSELRIVQQDQAIQTPLADILSMARCADINCSHDTIGSSGKGGENSVVSSLYPG